MSKVKACKQAVCPIKTDGKCLEGLDIETCPHFYWENEDDALITIQEEIPTVPPLSTAKTILFAGTELTLPEISVVTRRYSCDLIVILGDLDSGKTTLLGTIYDLFQVGHFQSYLFAGSLTQKGFEIRSHLSRVASGRTTPQTERTKTLEFRILHLGIKGNQEVGIKHLLLSDVSGETIRQARSSAALMKKQLRIAKYANHLFYVIDGEKLASAERVKTMLNAELFIQSAINNSIFTPATVLKILVSKWDKIINVPGFDFQTVVADKLNNRFAGQLADIRYAKIAARPDEHSEELDLGFGLEELLTDFMQPTDRLHKNAVPVVISDRFFDKFQMKDNG